MVMMFVALVYILVRGTVPPDSVSTAKSGWSIVSIEGLAVTITSFIARHRDNHWRSWWIVTASIGTAAAIAGAVLSLVW